MKLLGMRSLVVCSAAVLLAACGSIQPKALTLSEMKTISADGHKAAVGEVPPISGALSLNQAMARALKYNSQRRVKLLEEALATKQLDTSELDMLPKLLASAGWSHRSVERATYSSPYPQIQKSSNASFSSDPNHHNAELGLTWNLLEFGLGYYTTQQSADRLLIASEQRRKAMHQLMQDVRVAYWRAAAAQRLRQRVADTIALGESALIDSQKVVSAGQSNPIDALRYQRQLLENLRLLESINQELSSANIELASLIHAPLDKALTLADLDAQVDPMALLKLPVERLETAALQNNPDLRESVYNTRIARVELRKTMARMFPNISFNADVKYDSDHYLVDRNWNEAGLQVSLNLINLLTAPTQTKLAEAGIALADQRQVATQMGVITQVHISRLTLINAYNNFKRADAIYTTDVRIAELINNRAKAKVQSQLDKVSNDTAAIVSLLRRYQAMSQVQSAQARLRANLGLEPKIGSTDVLQLDELTQQISEADSLLAELKKPTGW